MVSAGPSPFTGTHAPEEQHHVPEGQQALSRLRLALVGPSGSGKTYSALAIATGLGTRIAVGAIPAAEVGIVVIWERHLTGHLGPLDLRGCLGGV
jgi:hypothetical protein